MLVINFQSPKMFLIVTIFHDPSVGIILPHPLYQLISKIRNTLIHHTLSQNLTRTSKNAKLALKTDPSRNALLALMALDSR